jgi:hypothetical protein
MSVTFTSSAGSMPLMVMPASSRLVEIIAQADDRGSGAEHPGDLFAACATSAW